MTLREAGQAKGVMMSAAFNINRIDEKDKEISILNLQINIMREHAIVVKIIKKRRHWYEIDRSIQWCIERTSPSCWKFKLYAETAG